MVGMRLVSVNGTNVTPALEELQYKLKPSLVSGVEHDLAFSGSSFLAIPGYAASSLVDAVPSDDFRDDDEADRKARTRWKKGVNPARLALTRHPGGCTGRGGLRGSESQPC